jgi:hypothetical protein
MTQFLCSACRKVFQAPDAGVGPQVVCPWCGRGLSVPAWVGPPARETRITAPERGVRTAPGVVVVGPEEDDDAEDEPVKRPRAVLRKRPRPLMPRLLFYIILFLLFLLSASAAYYFIPVP